MTNTLARPDSEFESGEFHHLVVGNTGRLLDPRRTPVTIAGIRPETATFIVRLDDFEDRGALWEIPFEDIAQYQFSRSALRADPSNVAEFRTQSEALDRALSIPCAGQSRAATHDRLRQEQMIVDRWLAAESTFLATVGALPDPELRRGDERLCDDLQRYMSARGLWDLEGAFARQYGSPLADANFDGTVDSNDTTQVNADWGANYNVRSDFNLDGSVGAADLGEVTANSGTTLGWGTLSDMTQCLVHRQEVSR